MDLAGDVGGVTQRAGAGDGGEVGEAHLQRDGAPGHPGGAHPPGHLGREPQQLAHHHGAVVGVAAEGLVGTHAPVGLVGAPPRRDGAPVGAPGEVVQLAAGRHPDPALEGGQRRVREVADGAQAEPVQLLAGLLPHPVQLTDVEGVQEPGHLPRRDDEHPVGLGPPAGQLGHRDRPRDPDRAGDPLLVGDPGTDVLGDAQRTAQTAGGTGDVEERLVQRDRLHQGSDLPEDLHHRGGDAVEVGVVGREHHRVGAHPPGTGHRQRRVDAVPPGGVVGRQHHPPVAPTHDHRDVGELGPVTDRHRGEERVHVDVQDRAVVGVVAGSGLSPVPAPGAVCTPRRAARAEPPNDVAAHFGGRNHPSARSSLRGASPIHAPPGGPAAARRPGVAAAFRGGAAPGRPRARSGEPEGQRVAMTCSWLARVRYSGRSATARSSSSRAALAPGSRSSREEGTRSAKTRMPCVVVSVNPALPSSWAISSAVKRRSPRSGCSPVEDVPCLGEVAGHRPGQHGRVPLVDQQGEGAAGTQHRGDRRQRDGRVVDEAEYAVAQHQVDAAFRGEVAEVAEVALQAGDQVGHVLLVGPAGQGGESVGAGVDDGDPVALGGDADREPAGAAADVEDLCSLESPSSQQRADGVPDHRGAGGGTAFDRAVHGRHPRT